MKKGFKRFLSGVLAAVMAVAGMTIGMATSAMAAAGDAYTITADDFYSGQSYSSDKVAATNLELSPDGASTVSLDSGTNYYRAFGTYAAAKNNTGKVFTSELQVGGKRNITITPAASGTITVYWYDSGAKTVTVGSKAGVDATNKVVTSESDTCVAGETFTITLSASNICLLEIDFEPGQVTTYNWSLDTSALNNVDGTGLVLGSDITTSLKNTLSYKGSGYTLKSEYETITSETAGVTATDTNVVVKPTDDWFDAVAPRTYVSVEPAVNGNQTVYNFVQTDNSEKYLISVNETDKSSTTAYVDFVGTDGTDNDCYVTLDTTGAKLCDDSITAAVKLVIPYSASTGKVTVSGTVTPTNNIGGKWKLVDFGCIALTTDNSKKVTLTSDNSVDSANNVGLAVKNQAITYSITLNLDAGTASGTITNGSESKDFTDVSFAEGASFGAIAFITNNSNSITSGNDRGLLIPSVTITTEDAVSPVITKTTSYTTPAVLSLGDAHYVVSVVSNANATNTNNSTISQVTSAAAEVASSDTVYKGVEISGTVYTAKDFCDTAADNDYVFASIISNDNATANETVISDIQKLVTSVK